MVNRLRFALPGRLRRVPFRAMNEQLGREELGLNVERNYLAK